MRSSACSSFPHSQHRDTPGSGRMRQTPGLNVRGRRATVNETRPEFFLTRELLIFKELQGSS